MDDTDDFIDEPELTECECPRAEKAPCWRGFGDDVAQRFLRLRGIMDEQMQEDTLDSYAQRKAAPRALTAVTLAVRSTMITAGQVPRVHVLPLGGVFASGAAR